MHPALREPMIVQGVLDALPWVERHRARAVCRLWRDTFDGVILPRQAAFFDRNPNEPLPTRFYWNLLSNLGGCTHGPCSEYERTLSSRTNEDFSLLRVTRSGDRMWLLDERSIDDYYLWDSTAVPQGNRLTGRQHPFRSPSGTVTRYCGLVTPHDAAVPYVAKGQNSQLVLLSGGPNVTQSTHHVYPLPLSSMTYDLVDLGEGYVVLWAHNYLQLGRLSSRDLEMLAELKMPIQRCYEILTESGPVFGLHSEDKLSLFQYASDLQMVGSWKMPSVSEKIKLFKFNDQYYLLNYVNKRKIEISHLDPAISTLIPRWTHDFSYDVTPDLIRIFVIPLGDAMVLNLAIAEYGIVVRLLLTEDDSIPVHLCNHRVQFHHAAIPLGGVVTKNGVTEFWTCRSEQSDRAVGSRHVLAIHHCQETTMSRRKWWPLFLASLFVGIALGTWTACSPQGNWGFKTLLGTQMLNLALNGGWPVGPVWGDINGNLDLEATQRKWQFASWIGGFLFLNSGLIALARFALNIRINRWHALGIVASTSSAAIGVGGLFFNVTQPSFHSTRNR